MTEKGARNDKKRCFLTFYENIKSCFCYNTRQGVTLDILKVVFPTSGIETYIFIPPLVSFLISFFTLYLYLYTFKRAEGSASKNENSYAQ